MVCISLAIGSVLWLMISFWPRPDASSPAEAAVTAPLARGELEPAGDSRSTNTNLSPERVAQVRLPDVSDFEVNKLTLDEMDQILEPLFTSLLSDDPARQRAALLIMGVHQGSLKEAGARYDTINSVLARWAGNAVVEFSNNKFFTPKMKEAAKLRNRLYLDIIERLITLHDVNNSQLVKMALQPLLGMPSSIIYRESGQSMREAWHNTAEYKRLASL